jgi:ATP-dependent DNA helicase DinG
MRDEVVAIDLETTGLDVHTDKIIEIGAVRMQAGQILTEYETLINPQIPLPERTTLLTGIKPQDIAGAPLIADVLPDLLAFVGESPIIGHSVGFDLGFLNKNGLFQTNIGLDTYDMASVLLPNVPRYNLHSLTTHFNITLEDAHRALDDARAAGILYWELYQLALALPLATLQAINSAARGIDWYAAPVFQAALQEKQAAPTTEDKTAARRPAASIDHLRPLRPNDDPTEIDLDAITQTFGPESPLANTMPGFEYRQQQQEMAELVANAFNTNQHLLIEAGTGTGKSLAYLVPAFEWASANNERVIISTDTIALQDQLINKDIPALQDALNIHLNAAVLKGRSNYLCPVLVQAMRRRGPTNIEELRVLAKILVWQLQDDTGDKTNITLRGSAENSIWYRLSSAEGEGCRGNACRDELGYDCPFYRAYKRAEAAHILIVNHALLVSDARTENRVLPEYNYIVIDEGHHLEEAVTNNMGFSLDEPALLRRLDDLSRDKRGLLSDLITSLKNSDAPAKTIDRVQTYTENVNQAANEMRAHVRALFAAFQQFALSTGQVRGNYTTHLRLNDTYRNSGNFRDVLNVWQVLGQFMEVIADATAELSSVLGKLEGYRIDNYQDLARNTRNVAQYLQDTRTSLEGFLQEPDPNTIYWLAIAQDNRYVSLNTAPLHVGPLITENLWHRRRSAILTSATLRTNGNFDHIRERLYADETLHYEVGSPFNYQESTLLYLPTDIPEPRDYQDYQTALEQTLISLAAVLDGRVMALFTSYSQLRQTSKAITPRLAMANITVYDQSDGTSRQSLLDGFKTTEKAVLLGTRSFWEGVDVPGQSLSGLLIARLPFPVPSDPVFAARSETYDNPFNQYTIPEAVLRFRQGFGRLIRRKTDRGVVVVMDRRITSKNYGAAFLHALPDCTIKRATLAELPLATQDWLDL